jgi:amylosucrase
MFGYAAYADRFAGAPCAGSPNASPTCRSSGSPTCTSCRCCVPARATTTAGMPWPTTARCVPTSGSMADLADLGPVAARPRGSAWSRPGAQSRRPGTRLGAAGARGEAHYRDYFYVYPDRHLPDAFEETLPEVFPDFAPGNFTWDEELRGLGVDDLQRVAVGRQLGQPGRALRVRRHHPVPGQCGSRGHSPRRHRLHLEAPGHHCQNQPEVHAFTQGAAGGDPDRLSGRGVQGRGDRRPDATWSLSRHRRTHRQGQRPRLSQLLMVQALVDARPATCAGGARLGRLPPKPRRRRG